MTFTEFKESLATTNPPENVSPYLAALWYDAKGNWKRAHEIVQEIEDEKASRIHAYLHRKEGDNANAGYWYHRAGAEGCSANLEEEWRELAERFLK